ncbi:MAG: (d)CMP kinase [Spirochaetaceae bacterium]|nr:(d)CMP kinase [Spirochaetaceae bacterium]
MIVAIDGPAGSGKSVIAQLIAQKLGFTLLNSGYFYRALTYFALLQHIDKDNEAELVTLANSLNFNLEGGFKVNNSDITSKLHSDEVSNLVAVISAHPAVRECLNQKMRHLSGNNLVCEGRDITTVLFPQAEVKIYLDAGVKIRAKRRFEQKTSAMTLDEIEKTIHYRDEIDKNKKVGALKQADDALYIDTSNLTIEEVCSIIIKAVGAER